MFWKLQPTTQRRVDSLHNYYQNCYGILLRKKGNSLKKRPKKIIISVAASYSYVMPSLKYVMQELYLEWYIGQSFEFWKMQISYYATRVKIWNLFFFLSINFIAQNFEVKKLRPSATQA